MLPAPEGAGPQSHYTESHALRLQAIGLLKDRYLPLREIRRELAGLDDADITRLINELSGETEELYDVGLPATEAPSAPLPPSERRFASEPSVTYNAVDYIDAALEGRQQRARLGRSRKEASAPDLNGPSWRRIEIADGVELLVREDQLRRKGDQLNWLINWARKVID